MTNKLLKNTTLKDNVYIWSLVTYGNRRTFHYKELVAPKIIFLNMNIWDKRKI